MAEDPRTYQPSTVQSNRAAMQGGGFGQKEMDMQQQPTREEHATSPQRTEPFDDDTAAAGEDRTFDARAAADEVGVGDLGEGTPPNVDVHKLGQEDKPQEDWGDPAAEGTIHSANHTRRGVKTEAERGQGSKTRTFNKDQVSRRT